MIVMFVSWPVALLVALASLFIGIPAWEYNKHIIGWPMLVMGMLVQSKTRPN